MMARLKFIFILFLFSCKSDKVLVYYDDFNAEKYLPNTKEYIEQSKLRQSAVSDSELKNKLLHMVDSLSKTNGIEKNVELDFRLLLVVKQKNRGKLIKIYFDNTGLFQTNNTGDKVYLADKSTLDWISSKIVKVNWFYPPQIN